MYNQQGFNGFYTPPVAAPAPQPVQQAQQQPPVMRVPIQPTLKGKPVTSIDEVRATSVDFDGSISYFPDLANNKIYTKQINMDGTSKILMYEAVEIPQSVVPTPQDYITRTEFETAMSKIQQILSAESQPQSSPTPVQPAAQTAPSALDF